MASLEFDETSGRYRIRFRYAGKLMTEQGCTLESLFDLYLKSLPEGAKEQTTRKTEGTHISHLSRHLKPSRLAQTVTVADMQGYIDRRLRDKYRGKPTGPVTVRKEVATFRLI